MGILVLLLAAGVMILRSPALFMEPRLWAEEGWVYYPFAYANGWLESLFNPHYFGYFNLIASLTATLAARLAPVEDAALISTMISFSIQLLPVAIVMFGNAPFWDSPVRRVLGVLVLLFAPLSGETWLNSVNSQFHLGIATFLILLGERSCGSWIRRWTIRCILVLAGLSGVISCCLAPLFAIRAVRELDRERIVEAVLINACTVIQMFVFVASFGPGQQFRFSELEPATYACIVLTNNAVLPFFGVHAAGLVHGALSVARNANGAWFEIAGVSALLPPAVLAWLGTRSMAPDRRAIILGSLALLTGLIFLAMIPPKWTVVGPLNSSRYSLLPNIIVLMILVERLRLHRDARFRRSNLVIGAALLWALVLGVVNYKPAVPHDPGWPRYREEVAAWRLNPDRPIGIWPGGWTMRLVEPDR